MVGRSLLNFWRVLGMSNRERTRAIKQISEAAESASFWIWSQRGKNKSFQKFRSRSVRSTELEVFLLCLRSDNEFHCECEAERSSEVCCIEIQQFLERCEFVCIKLFGISATKRKTKEYSMLRKNFGIFWRRAFVQQTWLAPLRTSRN